VILFGESYHNAYFLADFFSDKLFFKTGDESSASESKGLFFGGASGKLFAVAEACIIENHLIAKLCGAAGDVFGFRVFRKDMLKLMFNVMLGDEMAFETGLKAFVNKTHNISP
jgi:hypothetical protein